MVQNLQAVCTTLWCEAINYVNETSQYSFHLFIFSECKGNKGEFSLLLKSAFAAFAL